MSRDTIRHLRWQDIAPGSAFHAAVFATARTGGSRISAHDHDFYELMLVTQGVGLHPVNSERHPLNAGMLLFMRPSDIHAILTPPGNNLHWYNLAFPAAAWDSFRAAADLPDNWESAPLPPTRELPLEQLSTVQGVFESALHRYRYSRDTPGVSQPTRLELCGLLSQIFPHFVASTPPNALISLANAPEWLATACQTFERDAAALERGAPRLEELAGVSRGHLARTMKSATGQTLTEYVNAARLARAARLLTTTSRAILEIALECGFPNLSYFYRCFGERYELSPRAYRRAARRPVAPPVL